MSQFNQACCPVTQTAPIAVAPVCRPSVLGVSTGMILVLFILLVIILRTFPCF